MEGTVNLSLIFVYLSSIALPTPIAERLHEAHKYQFPVLQSSKPLLESNREFRCRNTIANDSPGNME